MGARIAKEEAGKSKFLQVATIIKIINIALSYKFLITLTLHLIIVLENEGLARETLGKNSQIITFRTFKKVNSPLKSAGFLCLLIISG